MGTYTMAGTDSTKWINRFLKGIGEKPIIYDSLLTKETKENLCKALWDMGYLKCASRYHLRNQEEKDKTNLSAKTWRTIQNSPCLLRYKR